MDKITQVLFSDIGKVTTQYVGKVTTQYVEVPHQQLNMLKYHTSNLNRTKYGLRPCSTGYAVRICMF